MISADKITGYDISINGTNFAGKVQTFTPPSFEFDVEEILTGGQIIALEVPTLTMRPFRFSMSLAENPEVMFKYGVNRVRGLSQVHIEVVSYKVGGGYQVWDLQARIDQIQPGELMQGRIQSTSLNGNLIEVILVDQSGNVAFYANTELNIGPRFVDVSENGVSTTGEKVAAAQQALNVVRELSATTLVSTARRLSLRAGAAQIEA